MLKRFEIISVIKMQNINDPFTVRVFLSPLVSQETTMVIFYVTGVRSSFFWALKLSEMYKDCFGSNEYLYVGSSSYVFVSHIPTNREWFSSQNNPFTVSDGIFHSPPIVGEDFELSTYIQFLTRDPRAKWADNIFLVLGLSLLKDRYADIFNICSGIRGVSVSAGETMSVSQTGFAFVLFVLCSGIKGFHASQFALALDFTYTLDNFSRALKFFVKCGFLQERMATSLYTYTSVHPFLRLESSCSTFKKMANLAEFRGGVLEPTTTFQAKAMERGIKYYNMYKKEILGSLIIEIRITRNFNEYINKLLKRDVESSASLVLRPTKNKDIYDLTYLCETERTGDTTGVGIAYFSTIYMHTHPEKSLEQESLRFAWWSHSDIGVDIMMYVSTCKTHVYDRSIPLLPYLSMVATPHGYFANQPTTDLYFLITESFIDNTADFVGFLFSSMTMLHLLYGGFLNNNHTSTDKDDIGLLYFYLASFNFITMNLLIELTFTFLDKCSKDATLFSWLSGFAAILRPQMENFYNSHDMDLKDREIYQLLDAHNVSSIATFADSVKQLILNYNKGLGEIYNAQRYVTLKKKADSTLIYVSYIDDFYKNPEASSASFYFYNIDTPGGNFFLQKEEIVYQGFDVSNLREVDNCVNFRGEYI